MRTLLYVLALHVLVGFLVTIASAQNMTEPYVSLENITVFDYNVTTVSFGFINKTHIIVTYTCLYQVSYEDECARLRIDFYNDTTLVDTVFFTNYTLLCGKLESICSGADYVNITGFERITYKIYDTTTGELLQEGEIPIPYFGPELVGYLSLLYVLVTIGVIGGFAAKGSLKMTGIGFIVAGVLILLLPYIGIYPPYLYVLFVLSIIIGIILLWMSGE